MVTDGITEGLARLGHHVADIHARRGTFLDRRKNFRYKKVGKHAGIQAARAQGNQVGIADCFQRIAYSNGSRRNGIHMDDFYFAAFFFDISSNFRFPFNRTAVGHFRAEADFLRRRRHDLPADI